MKLPDRSAMLMSLTLPSSRIMNWTTATWFPASVGRKQRSIWRMMLS